MRDVLDSWEETMRKEMRILRAVSTSILCVAVALLTGCFLLPNDPPVASFTATPSDGGAPLAVSFDASESYDPDGMVSSYRWSFGDGALGFGMFVTHVYAAPGTYTAELTVQDRRQASDAASEQILVRSGAKYAIIVGVANYPPPQVSLTYTDDDASGLRDRLVSLPGWDADHIVLLLNQQATSANFRTVLDAMMGASADDLLLVYFSGHGTYYEDGNGDEADGYDEALLFYDYTNPMLDDTLALLLEQLPTQRLAVIVDACYSGGQLDSRAGGRIAARRVAGDEEGFLEDLGRIGMRGPKDLDRLAKDLVAISACRFDEVSWEVASLRHGLFTYALLEALDGRADAAGDGDGQSSAEECYDYLLPRVQALALSLAGESQIPQMLDHASGELELAGTP
jgi:PKD repeat protein